jgi:hypothetical protein
VRWAEPDLALESEKAPRDTPKHLFEATENRGVAGSIPALAISRLRRIA